MPATQIATDTAKMRATLDRASEHLDAALDEFRMLARAARREGLERLAGEIESYTIGNLEAFADTDKRSTQMGSIGSILDGLDGDEDE